MSNPFLWVSVGAAAVALPMYYYYSSRQTEMKLEDQKEPFHQHPVSQKKHILQAGGHMTQKFDPINHIHMHVCGVHLYARDPSRQVVAHHYCNHLSEDVAQCVIYDSDQPNAKLIGIEYIISEKLFHQLPDEEKKLWHSHLYEVKGGDLIAPNVPEAVETEIMKEYVNTYGKTVHTWQVDRGDNVPLGEPQLMVASTKGGQTNEKLLSARNAKFGVDPKHKQMIRKDLPDMKIHPLSNYWESGKTIVFERKEKPL